VAPERIQGDRVVLDPDETRHLARVLRLGPGDLVVVADGRGCDYTVRVESVADTATGTILGVRPNRAESPLTLTLLQGIPKGDKMEAIVRAATELGVHRIWPAITARTVVRLEPSRWRDRARRWQRVAREATKQCGRARVPEIEAPQPLEAWLARVPAEGALRHCGWEGPAPPLAAVVAGLPGPPAEVAVLVGPEGGLAREEVEAARRLGWRPVSLGPRILRTETAGLALLAILQFRFGDLGAGAHGVPTPEAPR
jgi:16S rRNA (uracil1498-N3)-methyltransferase